MNIHGSKGESSCLTFLKSLSNRLFKDGTGDPSMIQHYLMKDKEKTPIQNFKGNRLNV